MFTFDFEKKDYDAIKLCDEQKKIDFFEIFQSTIVDESPFSIEKHKEYILEVEQHINSFFPTQFNFEKNLETISIKKNNINVIITLEKESKLKFNINCVFSFVSFTLLFFVDARNNKNNLTFSTSLYTADLKPEYMGALILRKQQKIIDFFLAQPETQKIIDILKAIHYIKNNNKRENFNLFKKYIKQTNKTDNILNFIEIEEISQMIALEKDIHLKIPPIT